MSCRARLDRSFDHIGACAGFPSSRRASFRLIRFPAPRMRRRAPAWEETGSLPARGRGVRTGDKASEDDRDPPTPIPPRAPVSPSAVTKTPAFRLILSRLNSWPMHSPADASPWASRPTTHGSGPVWFAPPSPQWTGSAYSSPASQRTVTVIPLLGRWANVCIS